MTMTVDFPKFFSTAVELYDLWPSFFNWLGGIAFGVLAAIVVATWWMRGYKADADQGPLKTEITQLRGEIKILERHLALARDQQKAAEQAAEGFEARLAEAEKRLPQDSSAKELFLDLSVRFGRVLEANNATTRTLTFPVVEFRPKPKPETE